MSEEETQLLIEHNELVNSKKKIDLEIAKLKPELKEKEFLKKLIIDKLDEIQLKINNLPFTPRTCNVCKTVYKNKDDFHQPNLVTLSFTCKTCAYNDRRY